MIAARLYRYPLSAFAVAAVLGLSPAAKADIPDFLAGPPGCNTVFTGNDTPHWTWITIYDAAQVSRLDWGWVAPFSTRNWKSGNYACYGVYHVRAEVKSWQGAEPRDTGNIFDTRMQIQGQQHTAVLRTPFYWLNVPGQQQQQQTAKYYPSKTFWLDDKKPSDRPAALGTLEAPAISLANNSGGPLQVWSEGARFCVAPGATQLLVFGKPGTYPLRAAPVANCGVTAPAALRELQAPVDWGTRKWTFYSRFLLVGNTAGTGSRVTFVNRTPHTYQFMVSGAEGKSPCLAPNGQLGVDLAPTKYYIKALSRAQCGDATGVQSKAEWLEWIKDRHRVYDFEYRLDPG